jgi:hypothetical protein
VRPWARRELRKAIGRRGRQASAGDARSHGVRRAARHRAPRRVGRRVSTRLARAADTPGKGDGPDPPPRRGGGNRRACARDLRPQIGVRDSDRARAELGAPAGGARLPVAREINAAPRAAAVKAARRAPAERAGAQRRASTAVSTARRWASDGPLVVVLRPPPTRSREDTSIVTLRGRKGAEP